MDGGPVLFGGALWGLLAFVWPWLHVWVRSGPGFNDLVANLQAGIVDGGVGWGLALPVALNGDRKNSNSTKEMTSLNQAQRDVWGQQTRPLGSLSKQGRACQGAPRPTPGSGLH